jgi:hypothetical protein
MLPLTVCRYGITVNAPLSGKETKWKRKKKQGGLV